MSAYRTDFIESEVVQIKNCTRSEQATATKSSLGLVPQSKLGLLYISLDLADTIAAWCKQVITHYLTRHNTICDQAQTQVLVLNNTTEVKEQGALPVDRIFVEALIVYLHQSWLSLKEAGKLPMFQPATEHLITQPRRTSMESFPSMLVN